MCEVRKTGRRNSGDLADVIVWPRAVAGGDCGRQPVEQDAVVGGHDPGRDGAIDPNAAVDVVVGDRPAGDERPGICVALRG